MSRVDVATLTELAAGVLEASLIDPDSLAGGDFAARLESLLEAITDQPGTRIPGACRRQLRGGAVRQGIGVDDTLLATLRERAGGASK